MIHVLRKPNLLQCVSRVCEVAHYVSTSGISGELANKLVTKHQLVFFRCRSKYSSLQTCWAASKVGTPKPDAGRESRNPTRRLKRKAMHASGKSPLNQADLVKHLVSCQAIQSQQTAFVMGQVDRGCFVYNLEMPAYYTMQETYQDEPLPIGLGQTISAPSMHGMCLDLLVQQLQPGASVLDVGSGSGYLTACMALIVGSEGRVIGVEKHPALAKRSLSNIKAACPKLSVNDHESLVTIINGNIYTEEVLDPEQKFDAIHVGAAAVEVPQQLVARLKPRGRMVLPVGQPHQVQMLAVVDRTADDEVVYKDVIPVRYVPLTRPEAFA